MGGHRLLGVLPSQLDRLFQTEAPWHVHQWVMGWGLISKHVGYHVPDHQFRQDVGSVGDEADGFWFFFFQRLLHQGHGLFQVVHHHVQVAGV